MPQYRIAACHVALSAAQIVDLYRSDRVRQSDLALFGEHVSLLNYLPFDEAIMAVRHGAPWPSDSPVAQKDRKKWRRYGDADLQEEMRHYRDSARQEIEDAWGISFYRAKEQFLLRMALAGLPEWETIWDMDGGWYQEDAYNAVGQLFGWEPVEGCRN